jgi:phosphoribosylanthranilate isomerase
LIQQKIIAQNITNLTDARYFAAWGVEYISFNSIPESAYYINDDNIKEIKDWVEGPQCLIEANALEFEDLADGFILSNIYSSLPIVKDTFFRIAFDDIIKGLPDGKYISKINTAQLDTLANIDTQNLHLFFDISELELNDILRLQDFGLVVQGGEEEKVGLKSYDELDKLYELLLDAE